MSWHSKSKYALFKQGANNQLLIWFSKSILNHISGRVMVQLMPLIFTIKKGFRQVQKFHKISHYTLTNEFKRKITSICDLNIFYFPHRKLEFLRDIDRPWAIIQIKKKNKKHLLRFKESSCSSHYFLLLNFILISQ